MRFAGSQVLLLHGPLDSERATPDLNCSSDQNREFMGGEAHGVSYHTNRLWGLFPFFSSSIY